MLARTGLLTLIFGAACAIILAALSPAVAMLMLGAIGLIYLITRKVGLPVPHLSSFASFPA